MIIVSYDDIEGLRAVANGDCSKYYCSRYVDKTHCIFRKDCQVNSSLSIAKAKRILKLHTIRTILSNEENIIENSLQKGVDGEK